MRELQRIAGLCALLVALAVFPRACLATPQAVSASVRTSTAKHESVPAAASSTHAVTLNGFTITAGPGNTLFTPEGISTRIARFDLPQVVVSIDRRQMQDTINMVDTEDALDYLPSLFVRKRNNGDTQAVLETRMWGINSSARSLVYVDGIPISALISNNNTTGAPRWGMVPPAAVAGIDVLYGPYAAQFPGNSMGGAVLITTRMPRQFKLTLSQTGTLQHFSLYRTHGNYGTLGTTVTVGDREGRWSWLVTARHENSLTQPLAFVTVDQAPSATHGTIAAVDKVGATADVVGASGLLHRLADTFTGAVLFRPTDWLRASYHIGYWRDRARSSVQTYLTAADGTPTFGGVTRFAGGESMHRSRQLMQALSLKTDTGGDWDWDVVATHYDYLHDATRSPAGVLAGRTFTPDGFVADMGGTGWGTQDVKTIWRPAGSGGGQQVSFGVHHDHYRLRSPTYHAHNWRTALDVGDGSLHSDGRGSSETYALWAQDAWKFAPRFKLTVGGRLERWHAYDGFNLAGAVAVKQPPERAQRFSPKATIAWNVGSGWTTKFSYGGAYRFPTVSELYQIVSTGNTFAVPNPDLAPEHVNSAELAIGRRIGGLHLRLSVFQQNTQDALISQTTRIHDVLTRTVQNVDAIRNRGLELVAQKDNAWVPGLTLSNSLTYVQSRIVADPAFYRATGMSVAGNRVPYVPRWRDTLRASYRLGKRFEVTLATRYQGRMYSTLANDDTVRQVFGSFDPFLLTSLRLHLRVSDAVSVDAGVDNAFDDRYFEYHPFPMRSYTADIRVRL